MNACSGENATRGILEISDREHILKTGFFLFCRIFIPGKVILNVPIFKQTII
jgi:hypothetical protein